MKTKIVLPIILLIISLSAKSQVGLMIAPGLNYGFGSLSLILSYFISNPSYCCYTDHNFFICFEASEGGGCLTFYFERRDT